MPAFSYDDSLITKFRIVVKEQENIINKINEEINEYEKKISQLKEEKKNKDQEIKDKNKQVIDYKNKISNLDKGICTNEYDKNNPSGNNKCSSYEKIYI